MNVLNNLRHQLACRALRLVIHSCGCHGEISCCVLSPAVELDIFFIKQWNYRVISHTHFSGNRIVECSDSSQ